MFLLSIFLCAIVFTGLLVGCGNSAEDQVGVKSYDELARELELQRAALPERESSLDALKRRLPDVDAWDYETRSEYLLSSESLDQLRHLLEDDNPDSLTKEQRKELSELTRSIQDSVWREITSITPNFPYAYASVHPARAAWVLTTFAHAGIDIDGMTGYFSNDAYEAPLAAQAFEILGMPVRGRAIRDAIQAWPDDQPLDAYSRPLDESVLRKIDSAENAFYGAPSDPFIVRPQFALQHPELFFELD